MMVKNTSNPVSSDGRNSISSCKILSQFLVKNSYLSVVSLEELEGIQKQRTSDGSDDDFSWSILGWFDLEGDYYAIVDTQSLSGGNDLNLMQLLTERELQIVTLIATGNSNKQVANQLGISEWTVSAHLRRIFIKLNVDSRTAMVYRCASLI